MAWHIIELLFPCEITVVGGTFQSFSTATTISHWKDNIQKNSWTVTTVNTPQQRLVIRAACISRFANGILIGRSIKMCSHVPGAEVAVYLEQEGQVALKYVTRRKSKRLPTTAILCRTMDEAKALYQQLWPSVALLEDSSESAAYFCINDDSSGEKG